MKNKWKFAGVGITAVAVGTALFIQSPASADTRAVPTFTKSTVNFCAEKHAKNLIRPGDEVPCVQVLQQLLNKTPEVQALSGDPRKPFLLVDGEFGPATKRAVMAREAKLDWEQDAIVGRGMFRSLVKFAPEDQLRGPGGRVLEEKAR
jgi:hypothetical protein